MKDLCLNFMKMVNKNCLVQQMIEKITLEVDAKIRFGKSLDLLVIESSLSNWRLNMYQSIDTFNSNILLSLLCSVIQGSKLYALLYSLDVPIIHKLVDNEIFTSITWDQPFKSSNILKHITMQYVITSKSSTDEELYINKYFKLTPIRVN